MSDTLNKIDPETAFQESDGERDERRSRCLACEYEDPYHFGHAPDCPKCVAIQEAAILEIERAALEFSPRCRCPRDPAHPATVDLHVYPVLRSGEISRKADPNLSMPVCDAVITAYRQAIRDGMMSARIDVRDMTRSRQNQNGGTQEPMYSPSEPEPDILVD